MIENTSCNMATSSAMVATTALVIRRAKSIDIGKSSCSQVVTLERMFNGGL